MDGLASYAIGGGPDTFDGGGVQVVLEVRLGGGLMGSHEKVDSRMIGGVLVRGPARRGSGGPDSERRRGRGKPL